MSGIEIGILGAGRFAQVIGGLCRAGGATTRVWARSAHRVADFKAVDSDIEVVDAIEECVLGARIVIFAVPASAVPAVAEQYAPFATGDQVVLHGVRGVGEDFELPGDMIRNRTCIKQTAALGGPLHSHGLTQGRVLAAVVASRYPEPHRLLKHLAKNTPVRVHSTPDVVGVEVAGAISNITAIATGICQGFDLGATVRGIIATHGLVEAQRIGVALGAKPETFTGLAGVGDLIPRHVQSTDRHINLGLHLAKGEPLSEITPSIGGEVEGIHTAHEAHGLTRRVGLRAPLVQAIQQILSGTLDVRAGIESVLGLDDLELGQGFIRAGA